MLADHKELMLVLGSGVFICICLLYACAMLNTYRKIKRNSHQIINGLQAVQDTDAIFGLQPMKDSSASRSSFRGRVPRTKKHSSRRSPSVRPGQFMTLHQSQLSTQTYETQSICQEYDPNEYDDEYGGGYNV